MAETLLTPADAPPSDAAPASADQATTEAPAADTKVEATPEAAKPEGDAKPEGEKAEAAPVEYGEFTLPEGIVADEATMTEFKALAAENKLPQEGAQKLVDLYAAKLKEAAEAPYKAWATMQEEWVANVKADPEIGGDKLDDTVKLAGKAMERFGTPELRKALDLTGAGNHPEFIRFVARVGKSLPAGDFVTGGAGATQSGGDAASRWYPDEFFDQKGAS